MKLGKKEEYTPYWIPATKVWFNILQWSIAMGGIYFLADNTGSLLLYIVFGLSELFLFMYMLMTAALLGTHALSSNELITYKLTVIGIVWITYFIAINFIIIQTAGFF